LSFYQVSSTFGNLPALKYPDGSVISYSVLNETSNKLAHFLLQQNLKKGDVIAIFNEKSSLSYGLMLAALKIGVIYTNLDSTSPWPRIEKILRTCEPKAVFIDGSGLEIHTALTKSISQTPVFEIGLDISLEKLETYPTHNLEQSYDVNGENAAYLMFTSGSTGFPKGAVMSHSNVLNFIRWGQQIFDVKPEDIFTNANPIYFDNSVFDFYVSLFSGASLVPLSHELVKDAKNLVEAINLAGCTIWFSVPSLLVYLLTTKALSKNDFPNITRISFGGEGFPKNKLKQLYDLFGNRIKLFNVYGPTECTCICSSYVIGLQDFVNMNELAPLGLIAPNFSYEILPADKANLNFGELALTGPCVGMGYYNDPDRTAASFVQNPNRKYNSRMYKTGDMVERAENGYLYFKGRVDNQIKHMGYRIELEEVEAAFSSLSYIHEVGVIYEKLSAELGQIKAFVSVDGNQIDTSTIVNDIRKLLPPYMVPRIVKVLDKLPKNANGKIDRKQLAAMPK
jgi:D-alanine--poly(phosphoribitol) ligase subunit 1